MSRCNYCGKIGGDHANCFSAYMRGSAHIKNKIRAGVRAVHKRLELVLPKRFYAQASKELFVIEEI